MEKKITFFAQIIFGFFHVVSGIFQVQVFFTKMKGKLVPRSQIKLFLRPSINVIFFKLWSTLSMRTIYFQKYIKLRFTVCYKNDKNIATG